MTRQHDATVTDVAALRRSLRWTLARLRAAIPQMISTPRERQEQVMRWIIFATVQLMAMGSIAAIVLHGVSVWTTPLSIPLVTVFWLVRILYRPD